MDAGELSRMRLSTSRPAMSGSPRSSTTTSGCSLAGEADRLGAVPGLPDHLEAATETQRGAHEPTYVDHVVDEKHTDGHGTT